LTERPTPTPTPDPGGPVYRLAATICAHTHPTTFGRGGGPTVSCLRLAQHLVESEWFAEVVTTAAAAAAPLTVANKTHAYPCCEHCGPSSLEATELHHDEPCWVPGCRGSA
jgi:hypothetical protein